MLNCRFCKASKAKVYGKDTSAATQQHTNRKPKYYVRCTKCNARGPIGRTEKEAITLWKGESSNEDIPLLKVAQDHTVIVRFTHQGSFIADIGTFIGQDLEYCKQRALTFAHSEAKRVGCHEMSHGSVKVILPEDEFHPIWTSHHLPDTSKATYEMR